MTWADADTGAVTAWTLEGTPDTRFGTFSITPEGAWTYTLDTTLPATQALAEGEVQTLTYDVQVTDEHGATATETVTITVTGSNDSPVAVADTGTTDEGTVLSVAAGAPGNLLANDTDVDGDDLTLVAVGTGDDAVAPASRSPAARAACSC